MAVFQGNHVSYGAAGTWYVQLIVTDGGGNTGTTTTVWYTYQVVFTQSISDSNNTISWVDPWGSGSANNFSFSGAGTYTVSGTHSALAGIKYGGGNYLNFQFYATGMAGVGGASELNINYYLPARHASPPDPPTITANAHSSSEIGVYCTVGGSENGATTDLINYSCRRVSDGALIGTKTGGYSGVVFTGLSRVTQYAFNAQAHNAAGWGGWSDGVTATTQAEPPYKPTSTPVVEALGPQNVRLRWPEVDGGGINITYWHYQMVDNAQGGSNLASAPFADIPFSSAGGVVQRTDLQPGQKYWVRVRAGNAQKAGIWSDPFAFETLAGAWITVNGQKKLAVPYINVNGTWKIAVPYGNVNGTWRPVSG